MSANTPTAHDRRTESRDLDAQPTPAPEPLYERVDIDRYVVLHEGPVGYIEHVAPVFVCYVGVPYPRAEEVAQVHDFHDAVKTVLHRAASVRRAL